MPRQLDIREDDIYLEPSLQIRYCAFGSPTFKHLPTSMRRKAGPVISDGDGQDVLLP